MSKAIQTQNLSPDVLSSIILKGDISGLSPVQKVDYYKTFCDRLGLDPVTQPFKILKLSGKEILYCGREGAQQLNKIHSVSHKRTHSETVNDVYVVYMCASSKDRFTESSGAVSISALKGDALANAIMKAETKAKRRATLDLLGLGILDESEISTIPNAVPEAISVTTGETVPSAIPPPGELPPMTSTALFTETGDHNGLFEEIDAELTQIIAKKDAKELQVWGVTNASRIHQLPQKEQDMIAKVFRAAKKSIKEAA